MKDTGEGGFEVNGEWGRRGGGIRVDGWWREVGEWVGGFEVNGG